MYRLAACVLAAALLYATSVPAGAPQPVRPAPPALYAGRWYQIAWIAPADPHPCRSATDDFIPAKGGGFTVTIACRVDGGRLKQTTVKGEILAGSAGAKFRVAFFGGLFHQDYWVIDHAADGDWALMTTPGGHFMWLLARGPSLVAAERAAAIGAMKALGFDPARLTPDH